jgi:flagellar hook-basal body complex protein FliE
MNEIAAIAAISAVPAETSAVAVGRQAAAQPSPAVGFSTLLSEGVASMDAKVAHADQMVSRFALDDSVPLHQVTIALEEARLSVEFAMQVRQRFVEGYRELMNMQL